MVAAGEYDAGQQRWRVCLFVICICNKNLLQEVSRHEVDFGNFLRLSARFSSTTYSFLYLLPRVRDSMLSLKSYMIFRFFCRLLLLKLNKLLGTWDSLYYFIGLKEAYKIIVCVNIRILTVSLQRSLFCTHFAIHKYKCLIHKNIKGSPSKRWYVSFFKCFKCLYWVWYTAFTSRYVRFFHQRYTTLHIKEYRCIFIYKKIYRFSVLLKMGESNALSAKA